MITIKKFSPRDLNPALQTHLSANCSQLTSASAESLTPHFAFIFSSSRLSVHYIYIHAARDTFLSLLCVAMRGSLIVSGKSRVRCGRSRWMDSAEVAVVPRRWEEWSCGENGAGKKLRRFWRFWRWMKAKMWGLIIGRWFYLFLKYIFQSYIERKRYSKISTMSITFYVLKEKRD